MKTIPAILTALALVPACALAQQAPAAAPDLLSQAALTDVASKPASMASYHGKPLIINFWARWCGPCRTEIPDIVAEYPQAQTAGVQVVGIALDDKPDAVRDFAKAYDISYPVLVLKNGPQVLQQLGNPEAGLPYTLVIDRNGAIVTKKLGAMSRAEWAAAVQAAGK